MTKKLEVMIGRIKILTDFFENTRRYETIVSIPAKILFRKKYETETEAIRGHSEIAKDVLENTYKYI